MDHQRAAKHKLRNLAYTLLLIGGMSLLLSLCSELLFGDGIWLWVFVGVAFLMFTLPRVSPLWILRLYQARYLHPQDSPSLNGLLRELAQRAELETVPALYWIPSSTVNAFAAGTKDDAAIAITDGLLQLLSPRETAGVLAHEVSHIANNDMGLMGLADLINRLTHMMSALGMLLLFLSLPLLLLGWATFSLPGVFLLFAAPTISALLQLGLSRIREFEADLEAARLTGDPEGLASALGKISGQHSRLWQRIFFPGYREPESSLLRTHPGTAERIRRLQALREVPAGSGAPLNRMHATPMKFPVITRQSGDRDTELFFASGVKKSGRPMRVRLQSGPCG